MRTFRILSAFVIASVTTTCLGAVWQGDDANANWGNAANWDSGVPTCPNDVTVTSKTTFWPTLNGTSDRYVANATFGGGAILNCNDNVLFVNGTLSIASGGAILNGAGSNGGVDMEGFSGGGFSIEFQQGIYQVTTVTCP